MIEVVAGVLRDSAGRVLLAQRPAVGPHAGLWEFPGGKREPGETLERALQRELGEELGIDVDPGEAVWRVPWRYPHLALVLHGIEVRDWRGALQGRQGQALRWVHPTDLHTWPMPAADLPIAAALRLPRHYAITRDPGADALRLAASAEQLIRAGAKLIQVRAKSMDTEALARVLEALRPQADAAGVDILVNGAAGLALAARLPWIGVHLPAVLLSAVAARPLPRPRWVAASCHDASEVARAAQIDCDFIAIAPVNDTPTHPGVAGLGWHGLASLCDASPLPVFALGGIGPADLAAARAGGAFGVAGIRAFETPAAQ